MIYLDYAATTPLDDGILAAYEHLLHTQYANSEALYPIGYEVHELLEKSRRQVASLLHVRADDILFTSGASEANSLAIKGIAWAMREKGKHIITSAVEHSSVLHACEQLEREFGFSVTYLPVDEEGKVSVDAVRQALRADTILCSIMMVNNETGTIQPIDKIKPLICKHPLCKLHVDCVQAIGKIPVDLDGIDCATISAHKIHGLKGSGILMRRSHIPLVPLINGGQQEFGQRGGTANAPTHIVFAKTLRLALERQPNAYRHVAAINRYLREALSDIEGVVINSPQDASPFILSFSCRNLPSEVHRNALMEQGFCVSSLSTCGSKTLAGSYVLEAMHKPSDVIRGVIRISLDERVTMEDAKQLVQAVKENVKRYGISI